MFGGVTRFQVVTSLDFDPAADDDLVLWVCPADVPQAEITAATAVCSNAVAAHTANWFDVALYNGGTAGTALSAIAGTIGGSAGWAAMVPKEFTISNGTVTAGQVVKLRYNEEGTGTFGHLVVTLSLVQGVN